MREPTPPNVLMLIKTSGLEYDDRLRKETASALAEGWQVRICAVVQKNEARRAPVYGGRAQAQTLALVSRRVLPQLRGLALKTLEMSLRFVSQVVRSRPDAVWCHNMETAGCLPALILLRKVGFIKRLVWDQHELPPDSVLANLVARAVLLGMVNGCDYVICANEHRRELLLQRFGGRLRTPMVVLENYPDAEFVAVPRHELPSDVQDWLGGNPYILAQGGGAPQRYLEQLVEAVLSTEGLRLIVVGPTQDEVISRLVSRYGDTFSDRVHLAGWVPQMEIPRYIDHAVASVVLYAAGKTNQRLCAPNRLYQAVSRGTPVVVGANPPMASFVQGCGCGVVLQDDGRNAQGLAAALEAAAEERDRLASSAALVGPTAAWESQRATVARVLGGAESS